MGDYTADVRKGRPKRMQQFILLACARQMKLGFSSVKS
jgi:hypothetical protein